MAKRPEFNNGGFYHVYNRGVDRRDVFLDSGDHVRFVHDLFALNDAGIHRHENRHFQQHHNGEGETFTIRERKREVLVDIVAWALMPNHYHLLLRQREDAGVSRFMQKLGTGYTMYFNERYERSGVLFQGLYKVKPVEEESYLRYLVSYLHMNPVALFDRGWKEARQCRDPQGMLEKLRTYRWSSYQDYLGEQNFPSLVRWELVDELALRRGEQQEREVSEWLTAYQRREYKLGPLLLDA